MIGSEQRLGLVLVRGWLQIHGQGNFIRHVNILFVHLNERGDVMEQNRTSFPVQASGEISAAPLLSENVHGCWGTETGRHSTLKNILSMWRRAAECAS